ncbi:hypothetical protein T05_9083 [Trichinella murrelli]|uniref:FLYWCH-type domain-containing protein n=1 Tax=Trichinella murrelli TaxID=144512 RepID=A0A0V0TSC4_9BILA|nr:hypothetical protein T05_9083 [Trichinella murrelli]
MDTEMDSIITNTEFVTTTKNKQKLVYRDQCYTLKRTDCNDKCWNYGVQQRRVAALPGRLHRNQISIEHFLSAVSYHTPAPGAVINRIVITFYKHYYCDELKRLVSLNVMPVTVIHDELASSASTNLYTVGYFPTWDQDRYIMYGTTTGPF